MSGAKTRALAGRARKKFSKHRKRGCQSCKRAASPCPKPGRLGNLSKHYESGNRGSEAISPGTGDAGGRSYGAYQLASKRGQVQAFIDYAAAHDAKVAKTLTDAGGSSAAINGTKTFQDAWIGLAKQGGDSFLDLQHDFIRETHYAPVERDLLARHHLNLSEHSAALRDVVWSVAVQHGPASGRQIKKKSKTINGVIEGALKGKDVSQMTESDIINAIYDYRGNVYWPKEKASRYDHERECALKALEEETSRSDSAKKNPAEEPTQKADNATTPLNPTKGKPHPPALSSQGAQAVIEEYSAAPEAIKKQVKNAKFNETELKGLADVEERMSALMQCSNHPLRYVARTNSSISPPNDHHSWTAGSADSTMGEWFLNHGTVVLTDSAGFGKDFGGDGKHFSEQQFRGTAAHEFAHALLNNFDPRTCTQYPDESANPLIQQFRSATGWNTAGTVPSTVTPPPTEYGATNSQEDLSESVMLYLYSPSTLKAKSPERYEFVKKLFDE